MFVVGAQRGDCFQDDPLHRYPTPQAGDYFRGPRGAGLGAGTLALDDAAGPLLLAEEDVVDERCAPVGSAGPLMVLEHRRFRGRTPGRGKTDLRGFFCLTEGEITFVGAGDTGAERRDPLRGEWGTRRTCPGGGVSARP